MKVIGFILLFSAILFGSWKLQEIDLLLGYTLGVFGALGATIWAIDSMARKYL
jgi:hypothetical protein